MKVGRVPSWLTHLLAASTGVAVWYASHSHPSSTVGLASQPGTQSSEARNPAETELIRRLTDSREEVRRSREENSETEVSPEPADTRPWSQHLLEFRLKSIPENRAELEALLKRAKDYEKIADLRVPLMEALQKGGNSDALIPIFLEWHRRDPLAAFDELAGRTKWSDTVLSNDAMIMFLKPEELLAQMEARNRSADFRKTIASELGSYLVDTDDLAGLASYYAKLDPVSADNLLSSFVSDQWVPRDGTAALAYMSNHMDESLRQALVSKLASLTLYFNPSEWSERFEAHLLKQYLGKEQLAALKAKAEEYAKTPHNGCGGGEDEDDGLPDQAAVAKSMQEKTPDAFDRAVGRMLLHDKDYPELFAAGRISGDEALRDMMAAIPESESHPNEIRRAVYRQLAEWNPNAAIEWASGHLTDEDLQSVSADFQAYGGDPRALRLLELMEALPSTYSDGEYHGGMPFALYNALEDWRVLAPEVTQAAMTRSPESKIIAERMTVEPESESDTPVLPSNEEDNSGNTTPEEP